MIDIYLVTNKVNGKKYVGQSVNGRETRWAGHRAAAKLGVKNPLYNAMRCYGEENFTLELIEEVLTPIEANEREDFWIAHHKTLDRQFGYNLMTGGSLERVYGEETLQKMREAKLGKPVGPFTEEHRVRMSEGVKRAYAEGKMPSRKGVPRSPEVKEKIRQTLKARYAKEGYPEKRREKIRSSVNDYFSSQESRDRQSLTMKEFYAENPDRKGIPLGSKRDTETKKLIKEPIAA